MNGMVILAGSIEVLLSLITGFLVFFLSMKVFMLLTRKLNEFEELQKNNAAVAFVLGSFIFSLILIVQSAVSPSMQTLRFLFDKESADATAICIVVARIVVSYLISAVIALFILWFSMGLYTVLTRKIDEMEELKKNNLAVGIVLGTFIFSAGILVLDPLSTLLSAFIASPGNVNTVEFFVAPKPLLRGAIELPIAFLGTIFVFFFGVKVSDLLTRKINETEELKRNNVATAIYTASTVFSVMLLVRAAIEPAFKALKDVVEAAKPDLSNLSFSETGIATLNIIIFLIAGAVIGIILISLALFAFMIFTRHINEMEELKKNNAAIAILLAVLTISIALIVANGMSDVVQGFITKPVDSGMVDIKNIKFK